MDLAELMKNPKTDEKARETRRPRRRREKQKRLKILRQRNMQEGRLIN